jgi:hypothetical protein
MGIIYPWLSFLLNLILARFFKQVADEIEEADPVFL